MGLIRLIVKTFFLRASVSVGEKPSADIVVHDRRFWWHTLRYGSLGLGETYMWGWCDIKHIDAVIKQVIDSGQDRSLLAWLVALPLRLRARFTDMQSPERRKKIAWEHYDLPYDFYKHMLGATLAYTSGVLWRGEDANFSDKVLQVTQERKFARVLEWLRLSPNQSVLDIGCGYGGLANYIARDSRNYKVYGLSNSVGHIEIAKKHGAYWEKNVPAYIHADYADIPKHFHNSVHALTSIEMIESVGPRHLLEFFTLCAEALRPEGRFFLQAIVNDSGRDEYEGNMFLEKYIFPSAVINSEKQLKHGYKKLFRVVGRVDITESYIHTLECWLRNMKRAYTEGKYKNIILADGGKIDDQFIRMFEFYLMLSKGAFMARRNRVMQYLLVKI